MGVVYKARDTKLDRIVALKFLPQRIAHQPDKSRFLQEAKSASALNHPNICTIYYLEEVGNENFIVMEYVDGATLRERVPLKSVQEAVGYAVQVGEALYEAHNKGIVHRDIKSDNIMINSRGQVKVMDFGLAKIRGSLRLTRSSSTVGTLAYMAPEQVRGEEVDSRSDIFSFGAVLFEMLTGATPFRGEHEAAVMYSVLNEEPEHVEKFRQDVPPGLVAVIQRCLEKDPADRYQHADDLVSELRRIQKQSTRVSRPSMEAVRSVTPSQAPGTAPVVTDRRSGPVPTGAEPPAEPSGGAAPPGKRGKSLLIGAAAAVAVLAAAGYLFFGPKGGGGDASGERKMLVVLPFENLGSPDQEYFADGITEEITGKLSGLSGLGVIATSSARQYKKTTKTLKEVGDELGVGYVLQGTIRWSPGAADQARVRVSPALIRIDDGTQVWSQSFNAVVSDVFSLQSDVAAQVAGAMGVSLLTPERESIGKRPTENAEAYDLYLRGNEYFRRSYRRTDFEYAIDMYSKALKEDPNFALAWAQISEAHAAMYWHHYDHTRQRVDLAKAAVDRALALDPTLPEAHRSLGYYYYWCRLDYETALNELFTALKGKPNDGHLLLGIGAIQRRQGKMKEAAASMTKAIELDPRQGEYLFNSSQTYDLLRDYVTAEDHINRAISLSPDLTDYLSFKARVLLFADGRTARARETLAAVPRLEGDGGGVGLVQISAYLDILDGRYAEAATLVGERSKGTDNQFVYVPRALLLADIHHFAGDRRRAAAYYDSARVHLDAKLREDSADARYHTSLGIALAGLGRKEQAIAEGRKGVALLTVSMEAWRGSFRLIDLARIYSMTGERDSAVALLGELLAMPANIDRKIVRIDPAWAPLRDHPGFVKLVSSN
jgi:TolB-like protein/Flp pilus assembly protein TadD